MGQNKIPDGWLDYSNCGVPISNTPFVAFKTPLNELISRRVPSDRIFMPDDVLTAFPNLGLIIDLTFSDRFYKGQCFTARGVEHAKIKCPGQMVPSNQAISRFFSLVDTFLRQNKPDRLIGVHCTHGLNRTGYFICRYMIQRLKFCPENAINAFQIARGHEIHRQYLLDDLNQLSPLISVLIEPIGSQTLSTKQPNIRKRNGDRYFPERSHLSKRRHTSTNEETRYFERRYSRADVPFRQDYNEYYVDHSSRDYYRSYHHREPNYFSARNNAYQSTSNMTHQDRAYNTDYSDDVEVNDFFWMNY